MVAAHPRPEAGNCSLLEIVRSHRPVGLLLAGAGLLALGSLLIGIGFATLTENSFRTTHDLLRAAGWLTFAAVATALAAVGEAAWVHLVRCGWLAGGELLGAAGASLLVAIGVLLAAASPEASSDTGAVLAAIGLGGWLVLLLFNAARRAIAEQTAGAPAHQSDLWLIAAAAVLFLAVATGLPSPSGDQSALAISTQVLFVVGFAGLAVTLELALRRWQISDRRVGVVVVGLVTLALAHLAAAISAGYVFSPSADVTTMRVGLSIPAFLEVVGWAVLAWAALGRRLDLAGRSPGAERPARGWRLFGSPPGTEPTQPVGMPSPYAGPGVAGPPPPPPAPVPPAPVPPTERSEVPAGDAAAPVGSVGAVAAGSSGGIQPDPTEVLPSPDPTRPLESPTEGEPPAGLHHCGQPVPAGFRFCPYCGEEVGAPG
ncbi:MAG TPA: zinc ribbon domain-containing protein [Acidimicrobiales bacterium]|nr:zinc ribbon domain-containing protein [Acidimicrobiales bacterium]